MSYLTAVLFQLSVETNRLRKLLKHGWIKLGQWSFIIIQQRALLFGQEHVRHHNRTENPDLAPSVACQMACRSGKKIYIYIRIYNTYYIDLGLLDDPGLVSDGSGRNIYIYTWWSHVYNTFFQWCFEKNGESFQNHPKFHSIRFVFPGAHFMVKHPKGW